MTERGRAWVMGLGLVLLMPLVAVALSLGSPRLADTVTWGSALGVVATVLMALVVVLVSRVRGLTRLLGVELGNNVHRRLGVASAAFTLAHVVAAVLSSPRGPALLDPFAVGPSMQAGIAATALMVAGGLVLPRLSARRYGQVARVHAVLGVLVFLLVGGHIWLLGNIGENPLVGVSGAALAAVMLAVLLQRWVVRPALRRGAHLVTAVRPESATTSTIVLAPGERPLATLPEPGQFVWLRLRRLPVAEEHPFTVAASTRSGVLELTVRDQGPFSGGLIDLEPGTPVWVDGPHGAFVPADRSDPRDGGLVLIAGGVGVTPIMSILRAHAAAADPRAHSLLLAEREGEALFASEILALSRRLDLAVLRTGGRRLDPSMLRAVMPTDVPQSHQYFVCGPPPLVGAAIDGLGRLGVPAGAITTERFG
ncbi:ferric reductase-like transmembrane domain-containing protein [Actinomycetospora cinnamomea]|uniref:Putative ferric reductase n=1 Tax=Actinomycetospora cinnamomea TaxID=663609 RepID=A0A2U1FFQ9_9PSEU|nr:ferric reductase-like transmembrane domain-containing protein [Actinomycetospora cinnamomea]PVZ11051.1 putative ferric reductase [Actinomycetospora cinnamomea]